MAAVQSACARVEREDGQFLPVDLIQRATFLGDVSQETVLEAHLVRNLTKGRKKGWDDDLKDAIAVHFATFDKVDRANLHQGILNEALAHQGKAIPAPAAADGPAVMLKRSASSAALGNMAKASVRVCLASICVCSSCV